MTHLRSQIFEAIKAILAAIPEFSGEGKVARTRIAPIRQEALPAITLSWADADERAEVRAISDAESARGYRLGYRRDLPVSIILHLRSDTPDEEFDRIASLIEAAMAADETLGGLAIEALLTSTRFFVNTETGLPLGAARLVYTVSYKTLATDPSQHAL